MRFAARTVFIGVALLSAACASASTQLPTPVPTAPSVVASGSPAASPASQTGAVRSLSPEPGGQQAIVDEVVRQAAAYANVAAGDVTVQQAEAREWGDSSLGCPRPGLMYSQVVTPGYLVVVQAGTRVLEYHSDARGRVVLCQER